MSVTQVSVERPASRTHTATTGNLNIASAADGIEFNSEIGAEAPEDPRLSTYLEDALGGMDELDSDDAKAQGVSQKYLQDAR